MPLSSSLLDGCSAHLTRDRHHFDRHHSTARPFSVSSSEDYKIFKNSNITAFTSARLRGDRCWWPQFPDGLHLCDHVCSGAGSSSHRSPLFWHCPCLDVDSL